MTELVYVYKDVKSFKVWGYDFYSRDDGTGEVIYYWGPAGKPMQQLQKQRKEGLHCNLYDAVRHKVESKLLEGYLPIPNHIYFGAVEKFEDNIRAAIAKAKGE